MKMGVGRGYTRKEEKEGRERGGKGREEEKERERERKGFENVVATYAGIGKIRPTGWI